MFTTDDADDFEETDDFEAIALPIPQDPRGIKNLTDKVTK